VTIERHWNGPGWETSDGPEEISPAGQDARLDRHRVKKGDEVRTMIVAISGTLMASGPQGLELWLAHNVATAGRPAVKAKEPGLSQDGPHAADPS
jgi:hypothetical protein